MRPILLCLDAVGTLIAPQPSVAAAYRKLGLAHGADLNEFEVQRRFQEAYVRIFGGRQGNHERVASESLDRDRWRSVVESVFFEKFSDELFETLWDYFSDAAHWKRLEDTQNWFTQSFGAAKVYFAVATNFDRRVLKLIDQLVPEVDSELVFCSTDLGFAKPDVRFYKAIEWRTRQIANARYVMVGDSFPDDWEAARRAGWETIHRDVFEEGTRGLVDG